MTPLVLLRVATRPFESLAPLAGTGPARAAADLMDAEEERARRAAAIGADLYEAAGRAPGDDAERSRGRLAVVALRRAVHNDRPLDPPVLAAARPWVPPDLHRRLLDHEEGRRSRDDRALRFRDAFARDLRAGRRAVAAAAGDPLFAQGVWLASRSLLEGLRSLGRREPGAWGHDARHLGAKGAAYLARFCTKTSPNGLFCATALAEFADGPLAVAGAPGVERVDALLNVYEARKVAACLAADDRLRRAIVPRPNPTLRREGDAWTFWRPASPRRPDEEEILSRVRCHPVVERFLDEAGRGDRDVDALVDAVARGTGVPAGEIEPFFATLVERGILIAEVEFPYNDRRPLRTLAAAARSAGCAVPWLGAIEAIESDVDALPSLDPPGRIEAMERIAGALEALPHVRPLRRDEVVRFDAASALRVRLPSRLLDELRASLRTYVRLFTAMYPERIHRAALAARFMQRHRPDTDVGLLDLYHGAFEPLETGRPVAFPDPELLAPGAPEARGASEAMARARDHFATRARDAAPGAEVEIGEEELAGLLGGGPEPRWSSGVLFQIAARAAEDVGAGRYRLVLSGLFQGTGLALARFAHLHGDGGARGANPVVAELRRGWSRLGRQGAILAEITYNHNARTANAGLRPSIFEHEIELPGERASAGAEAIPLRDLTARWDSAASRFVVKWPSRGVEVLPLISSGVNPVGFISFLVDVGQQGLQPLGLFPGFDVDGVVRWPRFVCGKLVLFRARWSLGPAEQPCVARGGAALSDAEFYLDVCRWRRRHGIPRHVFVHTTEDPKPRYLDLESPLFVDILRRSLAAPGRGGRPGVVVTEMLPGPDELWIEGPGGRYASEFLVHLHGSDDGSAATGEGGAR